MRKAHPLGTDPRLPMATRVFSYEAIDGRLLFRLETSEPAVVTPAVIAGPVVVAVRARCGEVFGQLGYLAY
jgi:hypothetical protein